MSAIYGIRYTCDKCGTSETMWRENGTMPAICHDLPPGWKRSSYANSGVKPLWQRPIACPTCRVEMDEVEAAYSAWSKAHGEAYQEAFADGRVALQRWIDAHPRPPVAPDWAR
ncbi:MAG TPA: hypothetical protein PK948_08185 [Gemmatimonadales bacterium]|nr:hypothetical protein [Gemmatimonadales bacterium]